jgi:hypothetical protein
VDIGAAIFGAIIFALAYMVPVIVAWSRLTHNRWRVTVLTVAAGWTGVGWAVALAMAITGDVVKSWPYSRDLDDVRTIRAWADNEIERLTK